MIFDTHIHLNDETLYKNLDKYITEAKENGVTKFLCVGYDLKSSILAVEIAKKYDFVYAAIGAIPTEHKGYKLLDSNDPTINKLKELYLKNEKYIKAIGEIGLDYYWEKDEPIKEKQKKMLLEQINLANELNLPVSIHCRDAVQDFYDFIKIHKINNAGVMHCYSGSKEMAELFIKEGYVIAFGGVLTFKNSRVTKEVIQNIPLDKIVFETDAPYLAPVPYRGKSNEPKYICETVKYAAELLNISYEEMQNISYSNSIKTFHV